MRTGSPDASAEHEHRPERVRGAGELRRDPVERHRARAVEETGADECRRGEGGNDADRQREEHRHQHQLRGDGCARADLELHARDRGVHRDVQQRDGDRELRPVVQEHGTQHGADDERRAERAERQPRAALELVVHAGAALPDELAFDQVFIRHEASTLRIGAAVFPSIQGSPRPFFHPKG